MLSRTPLMMQWSRSKLSLNHSYKKRSKRRQKNLKIRTSLISLVNPPQKLVNLKKSISQKIKRKKLSPSKRSCWRSESFRSPRIKSLASNSWPSTKRVEGSLRPIKKIGSRQDWPNLASRDKRHPQRAKMKS